MDLPETGRHQRTRFPVATAPKAKHELKTKNSLRKALSLQVRITVTITNRRQPVTRAVSTIQAIYRYPVKGLSPESLRRTSLAAGKPIAADRTYAIENGPSGFDPAVPAHLPKTHFLMLMRDERLAALQTRFDDDSHVLSVWFEGQEAVRGDLRTAEGRASIEAFFADYCAAELRGPPKVLQAANHSFSDVPHKVVSIINLSSVAAIEKAVGVAIKPLRFRGNIYVEGWPAWHELDLVGREIAIGSSARLKVVARIERCAATNVDPDTGIRDRNIPITLMKTFGRIDCGVYAEVVAAGEIAVGDPVTSA